MPHPVARDTLFLPPQAKNKLQTSAIKTDSCKKLIFIGFECLILLQYTNYLSLKITLLSIHHSLYLSITYEKYKYYTFLPKINLLGLLISSKHLVQQMN